MGAIKSLHIDGVDYTDNASFDFKLKYSRTSDLAEGFKYIDKITVKGKAYDYLNGIFFRDFNKQFISELVITPNCCPIEFNLKVGFENLKRCSCSLELTPFSNETSAYDGLRRTTWYGYGFDDNNENLRIWFCTGSSFENSIRMLIYVWFIEPIVDIINAIDEILGTGAIDKAEIESQVTGCNNYHVAYLYREVLEYQCQKNNLTFDSSILQSGTYRNLAFLPAANNEGYNKGQTVNFDRANAPSLSVLQLLEMLKPVFNAQYWIQDGKLKFERIDNYENTDKVLVDVIAEGISDEVCYNFIPGEAYAYGNYAYASDFMDTDGNNVAEFHNDIVEWNNPPQKWQRGHKDNVLKDFSPSHFMRDAFSNDTVDSLRFQITGRLNDLLLTNSRCDKMKLLLWDGVSPKNDARVTRSLNADGSIRYQQELYFFEKQPTKELYQNFHAITDPRSYDLIEMDDFDYRPKDFCDKVEMIKKYGVRCGISYTFDDGITIIGLADSLELDFEKQTIKVSKPRFRKPK